MNLMKIYNRLPAWAQTMVTSAEGWRIQKRRYDALFEARYQDFMSRNDWTYEQKCAYRDQQLQKIMNQLISQVFNNRCCSTPFENGSGYVEF